MIIVVDDERTFAHREEPVIYLRTSQDALAWFANYATDYQYNPRGSMHRINEIWFDHDLGEKSNADGTKVARFVALMMCRLDRSMFEVVDLYIHSQNPVGAKAVQAAFRETSKIAQIVPLPPLR